MTNTNFHEKIVLTLSFLILNNYLLLCFDLPQIIIKTNFFIFLFFIVFFYFKNFSENIFLKLFFALIILISLGTPTYEWDPRSIWLFHAKRIFYEGSIFSVLDNYAEFSHNDYPTLVPALSASLATIVGHWNEVFPKLSFTFMFLPPLILVFSFFKNTQYLIFLYIVFFVIGKYLFNGWADGLVAVYFCISAFLMYTLVIENTNHYKKNIIYFLIALCFFASLTLIKNEGTALLLVIFFTTFLIKLFKREIMVDLPKILLLLCSFLPIILWKSFCYSKGVGYNDYINSNILFNLLPRLTDLNNYKLVFYFLLLNEKLLICLIFFLLSFWIKWNKQIFIFISIIFLAYIFILFLIFLSTPYDLYWQLNSTAARVIKSLSFLFAFFALYNLRNWQISR